MKIVSSNQYRSTRYARKRTTGFLIVLADSEDVGLFWSPLRLIDTLLAVYQEQRPTAQIVHFEECTAADHHSLSMRLCGSHLDGIWYQREACVDQFIHSVELAHRAEWEAEKRIDAKLFAAE